MNNRVNNHSLTVKEIIDLIHLNNEKIPQGINLSQKITQLQSLDQANKNGLSFCNDPKFLNQLNQSKVGVILLSEAIKTQFESKFNQKIKPTWLVCEDPRVAFDQICLHFYPPKKAQIHPSAIVDQSAKIGKNASIGAGVVISENVEIGDDALIYPNVVIYQRVKIGNQVIIHSGTVIGSDGYGFSLINEKAHKQPQIGSVEIGNLVEIGANCAIDRGAINNTVIEDEVKIDNLVHIAHNVKIGSQTAIMGSCGIAGGAVIGKRCQIYGMVAINGHISIADGVHIFGHSTVTKSIKEKNTQWASTSREQPIQKWSKNTILNTQLIDLFHRVKKLENQHKQHNKS